MKLIKLLLQPLNKIFIFIIYLYQKIIGPIKGQTCRFYPTCSEYSKICFKKYNLFKASYKSIKRILKCNPYFEGGIDNP